MSSGKTHQKATLFLAVPAAVVGAMVGPGWPYAAAAAGGVLFGLWAHPDRDLPAARIDNQVGPLGLVGALLWAPYAWAHPHRSFLSHAPLVSTLLRLLYLAALLWLALWLAGADYRSLALTVWQSPYLPYALGGLAASDLLHIVMDR